MGGITRKFDRQLYSLKLLEPSRQMQIESLASIKAAKLAKLAGSVLIRIVDGQLTVLRNWLKTVDRICREAWQSQGGTITPEFVREILVPEAMDAIGARVGVTSARIDRVAAQIHEGPYAGRHHLAMEVKRLKAEVANHYEIEVRQLEYRNVLTEALLQKKEKKSQQGLALTKHKETEATVSVSRARYPEKSIRLTQRELKILAVIERKVRGQQYCRELDNAGIAPPRSGVWKGAWRKYESAYLEGKPWPHRIQDEKSKIQHKAKLCRLANLASE
jgi:hypothetical protein